MAAQAPCPQPRARMLRQGESVGGSSGDQGLSGDLLLLIADLGGQLVSGGLLETYPPHPRKTSGRAEPMSAYRVTVWRVAGDQAGRVDSWIWSVRLAATRSAASGACRAGHVRVNGVRVKPAHAVRAGDEVRLRGEGRERVVIVQQVITKRAGASAAAAWHIGNSPPPPLRAGAGPVAARVRRARRPTKR